MNGLVHEKTDLAYHWTGEASQKYQDKVTAQNDAIAVYGTKADTISKWLMDIAKTNVDYMTVLAQMATSFVGEFVAAAIEAATVIGIPLAVQDLAGAIGGLVTQYLDNLVGIAKRFVEALSKVRDILSMMSDTKLPKGQWPQAVTG